MKVDELRFDYSQLDCHTAEELMQHENRIKELLSILGNACWEVGRSMIGKQATKEQIANLLSHLWGFDKETLILGMEQVEMNE